MAISAGIRVEGGRRLRSTMRRAGEDLNDLKTAHAEVAAVVVPAGRSTAPVGKTGRLAASVRPGATKTMAVIRAGRASVPYAGPIHFGWPARHIKAQPWLTKAAQDTEPTWTTIYEDAVERVLATIRGV